MPKFHTLKIKDIRQETGDTVSIAFDIPEGEKIGRICDNLEINTLKYSI